MNIFIVVWFGSFAFIENSIEFRDRRVHELLSFLEKLVDDILADWKIEERTHELIYYPDE